MDLLIGTWIAPIQRPSLPRPTTLNCRLVCPRLEEDTLRQGNANHLPLRYPLARFSIHPKVLLPRRDLLAISDQHRQVGHRVVDQAALAMLMLIRVDPASDRRGYHHQSSINLIHRQCSIMAEAHLSVMYDRSLRKAMAGHPAPSRLLAIHTTNRILIPLPRRPA